MSVISCIGRIANSAGKLIFMDGKFSTIAENTLRKSANVTTLRNIHKQNWGGLHRQVKDCFVAAEKGSRSEAFWSNLWKKQILGFPKDIATAWKGSSGLWGTTKAVGGQLLHRLPLLFAAFELPNIFSAYKDEGIVGGTVELAKSATKFAGSMAGFIVGQSLIPIPLVGGLIGAIAADWGLGKILGKSHTEKKEEAEAAMRGAEQQYQEGLEQLQQLQENTPYGNQNQLAMNNPYVNQTYNPYMNPMQLAIPRATMTPQQVMRMKQMLYGGGMIDPMNQDFMAMTTGMNRLNYMC